MSIDDDRPPEELPEVNPYRSPRTIGATGPPSVLGNVLCIALGAFCILFGVAWALVIVWLTVKEGPSIKIVIIALANLIFVVGPILVGMRFVERGRAGFRERTEHRLGH